MMRGSAVLGVMAVAFAVAASAQTPVAQNSDPLVSHGAYLATLGNCMPCHTQKDEEPFAGARPINTPFGVVYSANLTPDRETGIGAWTGDQFYRALHEGIRADGAHLYPAFPYPYFTRISRADADAIYAYLKTLRPIRKPTPPNELPFPFNVRGLIGIWNTLNFNEGEFRPDPSKSAEWNRGAFIVTGLGHCGACPTPKNSLGGDETSKTLTGGTLDNWFAANLTGDPRSGIDRWTADDVVEYL